MFSSTLLQASFPLSQPFLLDFDEKKFDIDEYEEKLRTFEDYLKKKEKEE